ncbi:MAG: CPBP family intramembrane metalloprotease [Pseudomonadales bacterium]|nr:CPBP family intramembrane metalloprotease [Pseudomonadales bacterium]
MRRLQRPPDFTGARLSTFGAVFLRHGLPGLLLALLCLAHPDLRALLPEVLAGFAADPVRYLGVAALLLVILTGWVTFLDRRVDPGQIGWCLYLLVLSAWEEWLFRLAIPWLMEGGGFEVRSAVVVSNVLFGLMHYFTLRWRWQWCLAACIGGMALSRNFGIHHDLVLVIGIHWVATYLNTPRPPGRRLGSE